MTTAATPMGAIERRATPLRPAITRPMLTVFALVNFRGIKESATLNLGLTSIELTGLLLVTVIGLAFLLDGGGDPGAALEFKSGEVVPLAILSGASLAFFALGVALWGASRALTGPAEPVDPTTLVD
jgi:amino acid transporter